MENYEVENREWITSLHWVLNNESPERVQELLQILQNEAMKHGITTSQITTPYINTIPPEDEVAYPGNLELEEKLMGIIRWNAMAMVSRANKQHTGIGGHISTYASIANLLEVGFHHFFKIGENGKADNVYFQGHASPGIYSRAFLEGRLNEEHLENFRREIQSDKGLTSYPHPLLMPDF